MIEDSEDSELPNSIKIDLDTPLEKGWKFLAGAAMVVGAGLIIMGYIGSEEYAPNPAVRPYIPVCFLIAALFYVLRRFTDNFYVFQREEKTLFYHFNFLGLKTVRPFLRAKDVELVTVSGKYCADDSDKWYEYTVYLIDKKGNSIPVSDPFRSDSGSAHFRAKSIATVMDCPFLRAKEESQMKITVSPENKIIVSFDENPLNKPIETVGPVSKDFFYCMALLFGIMFGIPLFFFFISLFGR